ncbi:DNA polymerase IV [Labeo rohita]|uniref:DNA polymerase IV n=1 Tax=Labeo rohita TaxID=84645 RepID=A0ABQ8MSX4_LABRO|nr:DNA polymerase IV [Labeo rohita]
MKVRSALNLLSLVCLCAAQKKLTQDPSEWDQRVELRFNFVGSQPDTELKEKPNSKSCSNLTQVLDNWKYAIMYQVKDMLVNDHASILPEYVRIKPLSDAVGDLYKQFNTLKDNLVKLTNKFDKVESFVDEIQAGNFPRPKLWMPPRLPVRRIPNQMAVKKGLAKVPGKSVWAQRRARRGPST